MMAASFGTAADAIGIGIGMARIYDRDPRFSFAKCYSIFR